MFEELTRTEPLTAVFGDASQVGARLPLIMAERFEFEAVLGAPVIFSDTEPSGPRWIVRSPDGDDRRRPRLTWDGARRLITSYAIDADAFLATLNALHTLAWSGRAEIACGPADTRTDAVDLVYREVANTYPSFELRGLDWDEITERHRDRAGDDFETVAAQWVAELGDAHTVVRRSGSRYNPPYRGRLTGDGVVLMSVPPTSAATQAGVQPGWIVSIADPAAVWLRTGANERHREQVAARRALAFAGDTCEFTARAPDSDACASWTEQARRPTIADVVDGAGGNHEQRWAKLRSFDGSVDLGGWFDEFLDGGTSLMNLTLDLRGNCGGSLQAATELRDRFLRDRTELGAVRFTTGTGRLDRPRRLTAEPSERVRWPGSLTVLVDEMTYSAAEDFLLGLQGLEHVTVLGRPTGGGSGRPRTIPLLDDVVLTVSTALTYDRTGRCVELNGLPVDGPVPGNFDA